MGAVETVKLIFSNEFKGSLNVSNGSVEIGKGALGPYNLLLGALGSCLYHTFLEIVTKKKLSFSGATLEIGGEKRELVPATLKIVNIKLLIENASNEKQFEKSAEIAAKYCSIYETISKVASISLEIVFN